MIKAYPNSIFVVLGACSAGTKNYISSDFLDRYELQESTAMNEEQKKSYLAKYKQAKQRGEKFFPDQSIEI